MEELILNSISLVNVVTSVTKAQSKEVPQDLVLNLPGPPVTTHCCHALPCAPLLCPTWGPVLRINVLLYLLGICVVLEIHFHLKLDDYMYNINARTCVCVCVWGC